MKQNYYGLQPKPTEIGTLAIDLPSVTPQNNFVLIKLPEGYKSDTWNTKGGLIVSSIANKEAAYPRYGTVISIANGCKHTMVGDTAFFNYLTIHQCRLEGASFELESGDAYIFLSELNIHFLVRNGKYVMINGWCLMRPVMKSSDDVVIGGIIVEAAPVSTHYPDRAIMVAKPDDYTMVEIGDLCALERDCDIPVEYEYNETIERLFRVAQQNIVAVMNTNDFSMKY